MKVTHRFILALTLDALAVVLLIFATGAWADFHL
jgi:hypothetical protein